MAKSIIGTGDIRKPPGFWTFKIMFPREDLTGTLKHSVRAASVRLRTFSSDTRILDNLRKAYW